MRSAWWAGATIAVPPGRCAERTADMATSTATQVEKRDGYAEAILALRRAREAAEQLRTAEARINEALVAIADAAAATTAESESWRDVLATPYGEWRRMPDPAALDFAHYAIGFVEMDDGPPSVEEFDELEQKIRAAIEEAGPTEKYAAELEALWSGGDDA